MQKHLIDTDLYIDLIRTGNSNPVIQEIYDQYTAGIYFSSVVALELFSGARSNAGRKLIEKLVRPFEQARRVVTPGHQTWKEAGNILATILQRHPQYKNKLAGLTNDVLLAASARSIGATVYTRNREDFIMIQSVLPFSLVVIHQW